MKRLAVVSVTIGNFACVLCFGRCIEIGRVSNLETGRFREMRVKGIID